MMLRKSNCEVFVSSPWALFHDTIKYRETLQKKNYACYRIDKKRRTILKERKQLRTTLKLLAPLKAPREHFGQICKGVIVLIALLNSDGSRL